MKRVNRTKFVLLGLLANRSRTGYELKKAIESSIGHFWHESFGQIYPYLKKLQEESLTTCESIIEENRPIRKIYRITDKGIDVLEAWLALDAQGEKPRNEFLLKLFFGKRLSEEKCRERIVHYLESIEDKLNYYRAIEKDMRASLHEQADAKYWLMTLRFSILSCQSQILWCQESLDSLSEEDLF